MVLGENIEDRILRARSNYLGMLRLIDDQFRRLIDGVKERGLEENTIVVYLSDHGDFAGEYGLIRKGPDLPDILCRIPMIWKGCGIKAQGKTGNGFVNIVDILPTICDYLGVTVPFGCQGKSIRPLLEGRNGLENEFDTAYAESGFSGLYWKDSDKLTLTGEGAVGNMVTFDCLNTWTQCGQVRSLWKGNYHIQMDMMGKGYLYQLDNDPFELNNLWERKEYSKVKAEMTEALATEMLKQTDMLPVPHRRYRTKVHPKGYWHQEYTAEDPGIR